uniref:Ribosomal RNA large subunit methyltransferase N n=1 Tax=Zeugodacus cucurbitae TaxID=28588 RepID=A0A0A1XNB3_ZEUCU
MTNPKIKKSNKKSSEAIVNVQHQQNNDETGLLNVLHDSEDGVELNLDDYSFGATSNSEDIEEEEEDDANSCSSFSLQECINEFRARRIRRLSTQSREVTQVDELASGIVPEKVEAKTFPDPADADLISQNRSNKEHERKCKPCRDGFCYCFTSDSGEGGGVCNAATAGTRAGHVRQVRRHRRSDCHESGTLIPRSYANPVDHKNNGPVSFKIPADKEAKALPQKQQQEKTKRNFTAEATSNANELTAISRLETSAPDAPLIHIIQELHNNCVISEVRVNKHKLQASRQQSQSLKTPPKIKSSPEKVTRSHMTRNMCEPTAPPSDGWTAPNKPVKTKRETFTGPVLDKISEFDSISDAFVYSTPLTSSSKTTDSSRRRHKGGGRLLQKRLSLSSVHYRPRRSLQAPPKPPRTYLCLEEKSTVSSLSSTSPSLREAERILDDFLIRKGAMVRDAEKNVEKRSGKVDKASQVEMEKVLYPSDRRREHRKSCPTSLTEVKSRQQPILPSCPSLSDLERSAMDSTKKYSNYEKNIRRIAEKPVKELSFGWKEPKITEMLNCDTSVKKRQFKSQAVQAEPQQTIGWQVPPKVDLDTVDGVCSNLAANIATKDTPVKSPHISTPKRARESQKFIWSEQWRNLSPWCNKQSKSGDRTLKSNLKSSSRGLLNSSKKKILRLVTPKRDNLQPRRKYSSHSIGIQTSQDELQPYEPSITPQSPPGSYHSAVQTSTQTTTPTCSQNTHDTEPQSFDFSRTVRAPPKKAPRATTQRKLNFPLGGCAEVSCTSCEGGNLSTSMKTKTYRSYHGDLDQDVTLSKLGYILGNIRAKLEASDEHAVRTFEEIERREQRAVGFDCTDGHRRRPEAHSAARRCSVKSNIYQQEPIYSEIEEDSIHITGTPQYDNTTSAKELPIKPDVEVLYAKVNKANKKHKSQLPPTAPIALGKLLHDSLRNLNTTSYANQLPTLQELSTSDTSYMSPPQPHQTSSDTSMTLSHCQSLNNVRMQEHHSPPKRDRNLSKSDLSLHRSEIFLDNLCRSELVAEHGNGEPAEKLMNNLLNKSGSSLRSESMNQINTYRHFSTSTPTPNDSISYDTPNDADFDNISQAAASQLGLSLASESMTSCAQNSPKKQFAPKFTTKVEIFVDSY